MNLVDTFLTDNENFKFVSVVFAPYTGTREYTYKTLLDLQEEDFVVVQTPNNGYQVVQVREVMEPLEAEVQDNINYKWVVQKIDFEDYNACKDMEKQLMKKLKKAEARKRQQELRESASTFLSDEERAETAKLVRL